MRLKRLMPFARPQAVVSSRSARLSRLEAFGSNPGDLDAWFYSPHTERVLPLVVALHGCTQSAHGYDIGSGWSQMAEAHGFAVLFPEQRRENNPNGCFNWFVSADTRRGSGEAQSIAQMVDAMVARHGVDGSRVFITGLSAGGAMTSVMLATYPEKFAGGAIIAGLPFGAATSVQGALQQMRGHTPSVRSAGSAIRSASPHRGPWPKVAVWHGTADAVVSPSNADGIVRQWREVHGLADALTDTEVIDGHVRLRWCDGSGAALVEQFQVSGMGHGIPLAAASGLGVPGPFMLEAGISASLHSARTWGLVPAEAAAQDTAREHAQPGEAEQFAPLSANSWINGTIEQALRSAGLMK